jgi:geranylgeranyl pyrophosphate synthase
MDDDDLRRGRPTKAFGEGVAILAGDAPCSLRDPLALESQARRQSLRALETVCMATGPEA